MKKKNLNVLVSVGVSAAVLMSLASCGGSNLPAANSDKPQETTAAVQQESEAEKNDAGKTDEAKNEAGKADGAKTDVEKNDGAKTDATKTVGAKTDTEKTDASEAADEVVTDKGSDTSETESAKAEMTDFFISKVAKDAGANTKDVRFHLVDDINFDGKYEGFMFIGSEANKEDNSCEGEIWFVNEDGSKKLHDKFEYLLNKDGNVFGIVEGHDKNFVEFNDLYVTSAVTNLYYMDDDTCKESVVSRIGDAYVDQETGDLVIKLSVYDGTCIYEKVSNEPMWAGHSWKPYYFYYSRNTGDFMEYGAKEINASDLKDIVGTDVVKELEGDGYTVDNIIQRDNGIINVNYHKETKNSDGSRSINYMNATYDIRISDYIKAWDDDEAGLHGSDFGGIYEVQLSGSGHESSVLPESPEEVYGVFIMASKNSDDCLDTESALMDAEFYDELTVYTPDFSGLNKEPYYAVAAGLFITEEEAEKCLKEVKAAGFKDAYVKNAGKYIGGEYLYTMTSTEGISVEDDYILLKDVPVALPYPLECENSTMNLYVDKDTEFAKDGDLGTFTNYKKGETPYEWIKKNLELDKIDPEAYSEGVPLHGVFKVGINGDRITTYYGSYWWD
ncbi:hypothetical protein [Oribacterium sp. NK2B42]|uniref:hypothetical protein n=1 Tax=Oribacterium sp. NK2B42 TaxID=689781 RepID=UPI000426E655|nr:hypothetical protein [Oribacterium sp. NK2B42]